MLLLLNLPLVGLWVRLLQVPRPYLYAGILMFSALGGYALNGVRTDLWVLLAVGALGYLMRRFGYPVGPAVIGLILGPIAEEQLRRTLAISQGDPTALVSSPFAGTSTACSRSGWWSRSSCAGGRSGQWLLSETTYSSGRVARDGSGNVGPCAHEQPRDGGRQPVGAGGVDQPRVAVG